MLQRAADLQAHDEFLLWLSILGRMSTDKKGNAVSQA